ncbi:22968_t:CDS:2, partial [Gigaspora margarita]
MHFAEKKLYLTYSKKTNIVPIFTDSGPLVEPVDKLSESEDIFNKFEYEDKVLDEAKAHGEIISGSTACLANIKELPTQESDSEDVPVEKSLEKSLGNAPLDIKEKEVAHAKLLDEKDIFARNMNDLRQTDIITHEIDIRASVLIKQAPYCAVPS